MPKPRRTLSTGRTSQSFAAVASPPQNGGLTAKFAETSLAGCFRSTRTMIWNISLCEAVRHYNCWEVQALQPSIWDMVQVEHALNLAVPDAVQAPVKYFMRRC